MLRQHQAGCPCQSGMPKEFLLPVTVCLGREVQRHGILSGPQKGQEVNSQEQWQEALLPGDGAHLTVPTTGSILGLAGTRPGRWERMHWS
jgi:hypothetical protein